MSLNPIIIETPVIANLLGENSHPAFLDLSLDHFPPNMPEGVTNLVLYAITIKKVLLAYLFDDDTATLDYLQVVENVWDSITVPHTFYKSDFHFYRPLAYLRLSTKTSAPEEREQYLDKVRESIGLVKAWAEFGPVNFLHKYYILQAELERVSGDPHQAAEYYDKAIDTAYEHEYLHEAAIANELAAKFYLAQQREALAEFYLQKAWLCYQKWGAAAKVKHLEEHYPKYLRQPAASSLKSDTSSSGTAGTSLDINSILKATQTLSGEVQLKSLLENMVQILIENAGAQRGVFIEQRDKRLRIQAEGTSDGVSGILQAHALEDSQQVPLSVIHYVARSKEHLVFDNLSKDAAYGNDRYVQKHQPQSVVCFPVLKQNELQAILYLENNAVEGAFTPARLEVLNMLSAQIAISVENAELYENLEEKVQQRTAELQEAHDKLRKSHKEITDNVNYASHIQQAILPPSDSITDLFPEHFVLYQPRSVVSGDFYWIRQLGEQILVAAADCTGHGVSGALVSMLGVAFLNEIVLQLAEESRLKPGTILDELRNKVKITLKQQGKRMEQKEGMDIALCLLEPNSHTLQFAGAYNPLYLIRQQELIEIKADRMPIGVFRREGPFNTHELAYQPGDMVYLFSDGYIDQPGKSGLGGFSKKRFRALLLDIAHEPAATQHIRLREVFDTWKGPRSQVDDVVVLGIRL